MAPSPSPSSARRAPPPPAIRRGGGSRARLPLFSHFRGRSAFGTESRRERTGCSLVTPLPSGSGMVWVGVRASRGGLGRPVSGSCCLPAGGQPRVRLPLGVFAPPLGGEPCGPGRGLPFSPHPPSCCRRGLCRLVPVDGWMDGSMDGSMDGGRWGGRSMRGVRGLRGRGRRTGHPPIPPAPSVPPGATADAVPAAGPQTTFAASRKVKVASGCKKVAVFPAFFLGRVGSLLSRTG